MIKQSSIGITLQLIGMYIHKIVIRYAKAHETLERICRRLAPGSASSEVDLKQEMSSRLNLTLMRKNAILITRSSWRGSVVNKPDWCLGAGVFNNVLYLLF